MVDIAAQLSLTVSGPSIDPTAILGAETADNQAFGDILAGQVAGNLGATSDSGAPAAPLPPFSVPAGNRQPGGKILPGAAQILPEMAPLGVEAPAARTLPDGAANLAVRLVNAATALTRAAPTASDAEAETPAPKAAEASPVHALIKMLTAALKGQRPAADEDHTAQDAQTDPETTGSDGDAPVPAAGAPSALPFTLPIGTIPAVAIPAVPAPSVATAQAALSQAAAVPRTPSGGSGPILVRTSAQRTGAALQDQIRPALAQFLAQPSQIKPLQAQAVQARPVQTSATSADAQPGAPAQAAVLPVLTIAPASTAAPVAAVTLASASALPASQTVNARLEVSAGLEVAPAAQAIARTPADRSAAVQPQRAGSDPAAETPTAAARVAPAIQNVLAERTAADLTAAPATSDAQPSLAGGTPALAAPAVPASNAPVAPLPRQDFAALVDRLVEARNASAPQSTHASLVHAEFGQVSLHFQQDGGDLKVAMSSADPDFARAAQAAQAAQAAMPVERQNLNSDANSRGQSQAQAQTQAQSQTAGNSAHSHREAPGQATDRPDQQGRGNQSRNPRGGNNSSNPPPRWAGGNEAQTRGGIFA